LLIFQNFLFVFRSLCFISPKYCSQIWYLSIDKLITQYRKHRLCSDRRIVWLKNQYLSLYHENEHFQGPTPMTAILIFGGRQWNSSSLFSYERDHLSSKKTNSVKKTWSNFGLKRRNKFEQVCGKLKRAVESLFRQPGSANSRRNSDNVKQSIPEIEPAGRAPRVQEFLDPDPVE